MTWLMGLTAIMRYFVIAILLHVAVLLVLLSVKVVNAAPVIFAKIAGDFVPPPAAKDDADDPFAAERDFEYKGPTLGAGGGTPGKGPGGIPTAAGTTPTEYKASVAKPDADAANNQASEVIGVVASDAEAAVARLQGGMGGLAAPTSGFGEGKIGTAGVKGPGGGGFGQRVGPIRSKIGKGATTESEKSVMAALRWLKAHQNADGSWDCKASQPAGTALAVLSFLGHGETPDSEDFGPTVSKALGYLVDRIGSDGIVIKEPNIKEPIKAIKDSMYAQGVVTLALSEGYGMTQSAQIKEPLQRAVTAILQSQNAAKKNADHNGGWRYAPASPDSDTSVTGWLVMGLKSARLSGITIPDEAFAKASKYLWRMYDEDGGFGYDRPNPNYNVTHNTTAVGILCQQFMGHGDDPRILKSLNYYKKQKVSWDDDESAKGMGFILYGWYYITQAMFQAGGGHWSYWNKTFRDPVIKAQFVDGHWEPPDKSREKEHGPVYSTTMCCLMLEVYYRYLPIYQNRDHGLSLPAPAPAVPANKT